MYNQQLHNFMYPQSNTELLFFRGILYRWKQPPCRQLDPPHLCKILHKSNGRHSTYSFTPKYTIKTAIIFG